MPHVVPQSQLIRNSLNDVVFAIGGLYRGAGVVASVAVRGIEDEQAVVMNAVHVGVFNWVIIYTPLHLGEV